MPSCTGKVTAHGDHYAADFALILSDNVQLHRSFSFMPSSHTDLTCDSVTLDFGRVDQLVGKQMYTITVRDSKLEVAIRNGPKISGDLKNEVDVAVDVTGTGTWVFGASGARTTKL